MAEFPYRTLIEKAGVDTGFDRRPQWQADAVLLSSSHHPKWVMVEPAGEGSFTAWVPRSSFSAAFLDLAGVELPPVPRRVPWNGYLDPAISLALTGLGPLRALLKGVFQSATATVPAGLAIQEVADPSNVAAAVDAGIRSLPETTEITREVIARVGQECFREALIAFWHGRCAVTGLSVVPLLRASHIKPWAQCDDSRERLDVHNGLLLAPTFDAAFDGGWIGFEDSGELIRSPGISDEDWAAMGIRASLRLSRIDAQHRLYLAYHRAHILRK